MKLRLTKLTLISALLFVFTAPVSAYQDKLPFTGERLFNFYGGNGAGMSITIKSNGDTLIESHGKFGSDIVYQGKFKNPMYDVHGNGYSIKGNQIYMLKNGKVSNGCKEEGTPCIDELSEL